tara:strand:+ start:153 stop:524 length:372 start_codon:yes stop_codon:yes gene_type:complete
MNVDGRKMAQNIKDIKKLQDALKENEANIMKTLNNYKNIQQDPTNILKLIEMPHSEKLLKQLKKSKNEKEKLKTLYDYLEKNKLKHNDRNILNSLQRQQKEISKHLETINKKINDIEDLYKTK